MAKVALTLLVTSIVLLPEPTVYAQKTDSIVIERAGTLEVVLTDEGYVTYVVGNVVFQTETGRIYCDSAVWRIGESVNLMGHVVVDDAEYLMAADSVFYDIITSEAVARGSNVELWSYQDSLFAVGLHAYYDKKSNYFYMEQRPVVYVKYPDSARMIEIIADFVQYDAGTRQAEASGKVVITSQDISSLSNCAIMNMEKNTLDLFGNPRAKRGNSEISGELIAITFDGDFLHSIDVIDSATGEFIEPVDSAKKEFDKSILKGKRIILGFDHGVLDNVLCYGQAYSWYYPSTRGSVEFHENTVSGDTIRFTVEGERLRKVNVIGGAIGTFITGKTISADTLNPPQVDTIDYNARFIEYNLEDSMIMLSEASHVKSGSVSLDAQEVAFDTRRRVIEAYSASVDSISVDTSDVDGDEDPYAVRLHPNNIPVVLKDKSDEIYGDYLEYSIDTEKGRVIQSKSDYEAGFYYGETLFREQKNIFYIDDGRYTSCDKNNPHFHFHSKSMKLIEGDKLIAKPVVFYLGRIPLFAIPYYVFPLKKGRHSGFLPFSFGRFEKGERYVKDVGYYWAASEYWDWQGAFDYYETSQTFTLNSRVNIRKRYIFDGYITGDYTRETGYNSAKASETKRTRWAINSVYNHTFSPSFNIKAYGNFQSDAQYFSDYSFNLDERLNRELKSQVSFSKKFAKSTSLSGKFTHTVNLDRETRDDLIPSMALSFPTIWPFGSGSLNEDGIREQKWYQNITFRYNPSFLNFSRRVTNDSTFTSSFDTTYVTDTVTMEVDTIITEVKDTLSFRSRKKYTKINHNPRISLPTITLAKYFILTPRFNYNETWFKISETDQSLAAGIDASEGYRTYSYSGGVGFKTALYGTVNPNAFGVIGLRHVLTPTVSYSFSPEIDKHPKVRAFAGGGAGSRKSSSMSFTLNQLFQAKVKQDESEKSLDLLSLTSSFSYNFENNEKPLSNLSTSYHISSLPNLTLSGRMTHSFYDPFTDELSFWSPFLMSFNFDVNFRLAGNTFFFDETGVIPKDSSADSETQGRKGWNLSAIYGYRESGRTQSFSKSSFVRFTLGFNLTPATAITYSQQYDIVKKMTISNSVNIVRKIHCWTGSLWWVPIGSNRGFGFKLSVTALPEIKIDQNHDTFSSGLLRSR